MNTDRKPVELSAPVTKRDHVRGSLDAPVVLVEYGDYECPYCGRAYWIIKELLDQLGHQLAFVSEISPSRRHIPEQRPWPRPWRPRVGQGAFWEMHDWFYEHQHQLEGLDLEDHAGVIGLDVDLWKKEGREHAYRERVHEDLQTGRDSGVTGTPTFFMNGVRYRGDSRIESLLAAIHEQAAKVAQPAGETNGPSIDVQLWNQGSKVSRTLQER